MDLTLYRAGERVSVHCGLRENRDVLIKIRSNYGWVTADFDLSFFAVGESVSLTCRVDGEVNTLLKAWSERYEVEADGSVELYLYGTLDAKTETSITVRGSDGHTVTCQVPAGTDLNAFGIGATVKMHCHRRDGVFRLAYLKSERAVIELER